MTLIIFKILGGLVGMLAAWYISKVIRNWYQGWRNSRQKIEQVDLIKETEVLAKEANQVQEKFDSAEAEWLKKHGK